MNVAPTPVPLFQSSARPASVRYAPNTSSPIENNTQGRPIAPQKRFSMPVPLTPEHITASGAIGASRSPSLPFADAESALEEKCDLFFASWPASPVRIKPEEVPATITDVDKLISARQFVDALELCQRVERDNVEKDAVIKLGTLYRKSYVLLAMGQLETLQKELLLYDDFKAHGKLEAKDSGSDLMLESLVFKLDIIRAIFPYIFSRTATTASDALMRLGQLRDSRDAETVALHEDEQNLPDDYLSSDILVLLSDGTETSVRQQRYLCENLMLWVLVHQGYLDAAIRMIGDMIQTYSHDKAVCEVMHAQMGYCFLLLGSVQSASAHFKQASSKRKKFYDGLIAVANGQFPQAIVSFEGILKEHDDWIAASVNLSIAYFYDGRISDAVAHLEEWIKRNPYGRTTNRVILNLNTMHDLMPSREFQRRKLLRMINMYARDSVNPTLLK
jgi:tetratricopeptide (TPR) repeat protein